MSNNSGNLISRGEKRCGQEKKQYTDRNGKMAGDTIIKIAGNVAVFIGSGSGMTLRPKTMY